MSGFSLVLTTNKWRGGRGNDGKLYVSTRYNSATRNGAFIEMNKSQRRVFTLLAAKPDHIFSRDDIIDILYGDDIDGGPDNIVNAIQLFLCDLEFHAIALGLKLNRHRQRGASLSARTKEAVALPNKGPGSSPSCSGATASTIPQQAAIH
jgi:hypothetical protein